MADSVINTLAAEGKPITNVYGDTVLSGGQPLTAFNATEEQRANSYLLNTPTAQAERQQTAAQRQETLAYLSALNGGATRDYTLEEVVLGGAIGGRVVDAVAATIERGATVLGAPRGPVRLGSYDGASLTVDDARMVFAERELPPQSGGSLSGPRELPPPGANAEQIRSLARQDEAAQTLSDRGLSVQRLENDGGRSRAKQPDLRINGQVADVYSPSSGNVQSVWDRIESKANPANIETFQANNIVVNLADSPLSASEVAQYLARNPVPGLRNLVLIKNGNVTTVNMGW